MTSTSAATTTTIDATPAVQPVIPCVEAFDKSIAELDESLKSFRTMLDDLKTKIKEVSSVKANLLKVRKDVEKSLRKGKKNSKRITDPSRPTGFKKPIPISPELAKFLKVDASGLMSRTDVTKRINQYIKDHELQNPESRREFDLAKTPQGKALNDLLKPEGTDAVSYFNLQRWLAKHFPKVDAPAAAANTPPPAPVAAAPPAAPKRRPATKK